MPFSDIYKGKTVLVTGHTGFKGGWLTLWLKNLGANVIGLSLEPQNEYNFFNSTNLQKIIDDRRIDIKNLQSLNNIINSIQPDFVFHLAAQALVRKSYLNPIETWQTNLLGTVNVLESLKNIRKKSACVLITSDKCYKNKEWVWGYREDDQLGGADPYSASKAAAELAINSYIKSFFGKDKPYIRISSARAGNVIGGGDWSKDRIVPDCVKAWSKGDLVKLRSPNSTRPWQHVLEPISGYLELGNHLYKDELFHGESFNFGPKSGDNYSVEKLVQKMSFYWDKVLWENSSDKDQPYESGLLKLNCDKALLKMKWESNLSFEDTLRFTIEWYKNFYDFKDCMREKSIEQINEYCKIAKKSSISWANN